MSMVKSFSISRKLNQFCLTLYCLSPSGKEHLATSIQKAVEKWKLKLPQADESKYIGQGIVV
jgi:hypothetical protein